jgi:hypothetical protein
VTVRAAFICAFALGVGAALPLLAIELLIAVLR